MSNFHGRTHLVLVERTSEGLIRSFEILNYTLGDQNDLTMVLYKNRWVFVGNGEELRAVVDKRKENW